MKSYLTLSRFEAFEKCFPPLAGFNAKGNSAGKRNWTKSFLPEGRGAWMPRVNAKILTGGILNSILRLKILSLTPVE